MATRYHHGHLRAALLDASRAILSERGARSLSLREAARRAGVSSAAPYRHFKDKQSLLVALSQAAFERLDQRLAEVAAARADEPALARVQALGIAYVEFAADAPAEFRIMFGEFAPRADSDPGLAAATAAVASHLPRALSELLQESGSSGASVEDLTLLAWSVVHGLSTLYLDGHLGYFDGARARPDASAIARRITGVLAGVLEGQLAAGARGASA